MRRLTTGTTAVLTLGRLTSSGRRAARLTLAVAALAAAMPGRVDAQFGLQKKLKSAKDAISAPDSAARAKDSLARLQNISNGEVVADSTKQGSLFSRAKSAAIGASDKFEAVTGVSAKDAALAATGAGIAGIAAKKLGVDPTSIVNNAVSKAVASAQQKATQAATGAIPGMPGGDAMSATAGAMPDAQVMVAFQQSMMKVSMEATAGSASARAKLDAWQRMSEKFEAEAEKLNLSIAAGDMTAYTKLQSLQTKMMRDWLTAYGDVPAKATPKAKP